MNTLFLKRIAASIVFVFTSVYCFAQLSGTAFLASQSNHSGIKVKFKANPGTAISDSTYTDASGNYSINITGGSYNVSFSKGGYQSIYYNSNQAVILTNTVIIGPLTLNLGNVIMVSSGTVSGVWVNTNIYQVNGDITIPMGSTLIISPGTMVKFNGSYSLTANGVLNAIGGPYNGNIIFTSNFTPANPNDWKGIYLYNGLSELKYCTVENAYTGITVKNCNSKITYNTIKKFEWVGIDLDYSSSLVTNNEIYDYNYQYYSIGIQLYSSKPVVECNTIYNGSGRGIRSFSKGVIRNNVIHHINDPQRGYGIDCGVFDSSLVINNIIHDCIIGILVGDNVTPSPTPILVNNTIFSNTTGVSCYGFHSNPAIINNIIINNINGISQNPEPGAIPSEVSHNDVWNNSQLDYYGVQVLGVGQVVSTNSNGDPVDAYFNISKDPIFYNGQPPYLGLGSPCLNVGKMNYSSNIGVSTNSFCSGMEIGIKENRNNFDYRVYPNPVSNEFFVVSSERVEARLFDLYGRSLQILSEHLSDKEIRIVSSDLAPGVYFLEMESRNYKQTIKLIKY